MTTFVLTVIGDDRPGLVSALSGSITAHGGNWERSQLAHLAGKFAGIVEGSVAAERYDALVAELTSLEARGLHVTFERADPVEDAQDAEDAEAHGFVLELIGDDRPG